MQFLLDFASILRQLNPGLMYEVANASPAPAEYLFSTSVLPIVPSASFSVENARMKFHSTMAGLVGMDSLPMETGAIEGEEWAARTAKIGAMTSLNEVQQREILERAKNIALGMGNGQTHQQLLTNASLGLWQKGVIQPMNDTVEWMCSRAVTTGKLKWSYNGNHLDVDYGVPKENSIEVPAAQWFDTAGSNFWNILNMAQLKLNRRVKAIIMDDNLLTAILNNDAHSIDIVSETVSPQGNIRRVEIRRSIRDSLGNVLAFDKNVRTSVVLWSYARQGTILGADGKTLINLPMVDPNRITLIGQGGVGGGFSLDGTVGYDAPQRLGYYHRGPTIEGQGAIGRWTRMFTPQNYPTKIIGEGYENGLPIVEAPELLVHISKKG